MLEDQTQISRALILMLQRHEMVYEKEILIYFTEAVPGPQGRIIQVQF